MFVFLIINAIILPQINERISIFRRRFGCNEVHDETIVTDFANDLTRLDSICRAERAPIAIKLHPAQRVPAGTPVDHQ